MYLQQKYIGFLGSYLEQFKQTNQNLYTFRCPLCLDSKKSKTKKRGYIFLHENTYFFKCHNCGVSLSFAQLLRQVNPVLYNDYIFERVSKGDLTKEKAPEKPKSAKPVFLHKTKLEIPSVRDLEPSHIAVAFCKRRKIPEDKFHLIFYAENFQTFSNQIAPEKYSFGTEPRIVLPFYDKEGHLIGAQGRAILKSSARYETAKIDDETRMIYGQERIDERKAVLVVEGPIDSLFLSNCVAMAGCHSTDIPYKNCVYIYDAEPRNSQLVTKLESLIDTGKKVVLWDETFMPYGKDVNDFVINGIDIEIIERYIHKNAVSGLKAKLKLAEWRKC